MTRRQQMRRATPFALALLTLLGLATAIYAQVTSATLTGIVKDGTGAILPGVKVSVTNLETNIVREVYTNDTGNYRVPALNPGTYKIESELPGFKKSVLTGIVLQVNQQARLDVTLEVGQITESVTVESASPLIDTESAIIGGVVNESKVVGLPLNGRN